MENEADSSFPLTLETNQTAETFVRKPLGEVSTARLFSFRSREAQTQALPSQDYARVSSNRKGSSLCFCVCDGVGSSYKGGFAARYLAVCLVDWLQTLTAIPRKRTKIAKDLQSLLDQCASRAQSELKQLSIPSETPALVREVLEDLRDNYGSETVFLCGRVDHARRVSQPTPVYTVRALLCWMGNVSAYLFTPPGQQITVDN